METYKISPIGFVKNIRENLEDDYWGNLVSEIKLNEDIPQESILGLEDFSHLEIIFYFDKVSKEKIILGASHPRNNLVWPKVGIFAQRKKNRPNCLGLSIVSLLKIEKKSIFVKGLDAINGTPIIDIKPVMKEFLPSNEIKQPSWVSELMEKYWLNKK